MFRDKDQTKPQFICSTQPLALLLSRDCILSFDGAVYGLYYPRTGRSSLRVTNEDEELNKYLTKKGAFITPSISEQRHLVSLYLDNLYCIYPVVSRNILDDIHLIPLILLNAIFLSAIRFDKTLKPKDIRERLLEFLERCKLLEAIETNKIVLIQSYLLMSMHEEGSEGMTSSKEYISKATNICGELAITNMGGALEEHVFVDHEISDLKSKNQYTKQLLNRIFWCAYCLDRMISATCGREIIFNRLDLMVDKLERTDFDEGPDRDSDFKIFNSWYQICEAIERIQHCLYRPPNNRSIDPCLNNDIDNWKSPNLSDSKFQKYLVFLKTAQCYAKLLYLRGSVDSISIFLEDMNDAKDQGILAQIHNVSEKVLDLVNPPDVVHNVLVVHAVLHVIALLQLESKVQPDLLDEPNFSKYYKNISSTSIEKLKILKDYWWYAGSALVLCQAIFDMN